jgi:tRNA(fMet)-specific endonuclease VapC
MKYVLDTNIITAYLKGNERVKQRVQQVVLEGKEILINGISYYEIKRGLLAKNAITQLKEFELLGREFGLVLLDSQDIFDRASEMYANLKQEGELISDADILIAALVITRNFTLVSADNDFNRIQELKLQNWLS